MMGMVERIISREREKALKTLLDDPSPPVRRAVASMLSDDRPEAPAS